MPKLVAFDVDGVLLDCDIGGFKELAIQFGKEKEVREHDEEYQRRKHLGPWGLEELAMMFAGIPEHTVNEKARALVQKHLRPDAYDVVRSAKQKGYLVVAYSSNPIWIMQELKYFLGLDDICGNVVESKNGIITGKLLEKIDRFGKERRLARFMETHRISPDEAVIFGDSVTDLPMAQHGTFYAFNAKDEKVQQTAQSVIEPPLSNVLKYL